MFLFPQVNGRLRRIAAWLTFANNTLYSFVVVVVVVVAAADKDIYSQGFGYKVDTAKKAQT